MAAIIKMRVSCCLHANSFLFIITKYSLYTQTLDPRCVFCRLLKLCFLYQRWFSRCIFSSGRGGFGTGFVFRRGPREELLEIVYQTVRREIYAGPSTLLWVRSTLLCPLTSLGNRLHCFTPAPWAASNFASFLEHHSSLQIQHDHHCFSPASILWTRHY